MTITRLTLVASLVLMILGACSPGPPESYDWCYNFDFTENNDFGVAYGTWQEGVGYVTDAAYRLVLSYGVAAPVYPNKVLIRATRIDNGDISVAATGNVFGIEGNITETLPAALTNAEIGLSALSADTNGTSANVSVIASGAIAVTSVELYGRFDNPFGVSNCGDVQPTETVPVQTLTPFPTLTLTPVTPSDTPTLTQTLTPTPTLTYTPSSTPACSWEYIFDFTSSDGGWVLTPASGDIPTYGVYSSGNGWTTTDGTEVASTNSNRALDIGKSWTTVATITYLAINFDYTKGTFDANVTAHSVSSTGVGRISVSGSSATSGTNKTLSWTGSATNQTSIKVYLRSSADTNPPYTWSGAATLKSVTVRGTGYNPFTGLDGCITPTITNTPTITHTPVPTNTPNPTVPTNTRTPNPTFTPAYTPSATLNPSRTPIPIYVPPTSLPSSATPLVSPTPNLTQTSQAQQTATSSALTATATGTSIGGGGTGTLDGIGDASDSIGGISGIGSAVSAFLTNGLSTVGAWWGQVGVAFNTVNEGWVNTAAAPMPGVPQCLTAPLSSELCAIYYILTYTLLSGTLGALIVPTGTVVVDLFGIFLFIRLGRAIVARLTEIVK